MNYDHKTAIHIIGLAAVLFLASCATKQKGKVGEVLDEARQSEPRCSLFAGGGRRLLPRHGWRNPAHPRRGNGPEHLAGLDRRQRCLCGTI